MTDSFPLATPPANGHSSPPMAAATVEETQSLILASAPIEVGDIEFSCSCPDKLFEAFSSAQASMENPVKNRTAKIYGKEGKPGFEYQYADLAAVLDAVKKPFADNHLTLIQAPGTKESAVSITTIIGHKSGQWMRTTIKWNAGGWDIKLLGIAITYMRRYALQSMTGIAADEDRDALPEGDHADRRSAAPQQQQKPAAAKAVPMAQKPAEAMQGTPDRTNPTMDIKTPAPPKAAPPAKIEDRRKAIAGEIRDALGLKPAADTDLGKLLMVLYRGYIGGPKTGALPEQDKNNLPVWHECLLALKAAVAQGEVSVETLKADPYSLGHTLKSALDAAPEEPAETEESRPHTDPTEVTEAMLCEKYQTTPATLTSWMQFSGVSSRSAEEQAAWRKILWHTKMAKMVVSDHFPITAAVSEIENRLGCPLTPKTETVEEDFKKLLAAVADHLRSKK